jgi:hypothetical protein
MMEEVMMIVSVVLAVLLALSEALALIPAVKANGIFQALVNGMKFLKDKLLPSP